MLSKMAKNQDEAMEEAKKVTGNQALKDQQAIIAMLKQMGMRECKPGVVNRLLDYAYKHASKVLENAKANSELAKKPIVDVHDIKFAIEQEKLASRPSRDSLVKMAEKSNSIPLPPITPTCGLRLPDEEYCLTAEKVKLKDLSELMPKKSSSEVPRTKAEIPKEFPKSKFRIVIPGDKKDLNEPKKTVIITKVTAPMKTNITTNTTSKRYVPTNPFPIESRFGSMSPGRIQAPKHTYGSRRLIPLRQVPTTCTVTSATVQRPITVALPCAGLKRKHEDDNKAERKDSLKTDSQTDEVLKADKPKPNEDPVKEFKVDFSFEDCLFDIPEELTNNTDELKQNLDKDEEDFDIDQFLSKF